MRKLSLSLTRPAVAMGLLEMALRIPVNEGCWGGGRGTRRQVNKSAICKRVCLTSSEPNSVIGLPSVGGVEGGGGLPLQPWTPHSGGHWRVCRANRAPRRGLREPCEPTAASHIHPLRKEDDGGQKEEGDSLVGADRSIHRQK